MQRVIITGADGFVGSYTVQCFIQNGIEVLALDIGSEPKRLHPEGLLRYRQVDVTNTNALISAAGNGEYDAFIHFAWIGSAGMERVDYAKQMENAINTVECLKAAKKIGCSRFVCAGSIMEREIEAALHTQGSKPAMGYIYGIGKYTAHSLCKSVAADIGIDLIWPMITNAYGQGEYSPRFVNTTIRKIIDGKPLQFTAGTQNYDFVYVTDVARAFYLITKNGKPFYEYLIGSGNARPLRSFIIEMVNVLDPDATPLFGDIPFTGTNLPLHAFDTTQTKQDCGFSAETSFAQGIEQTMRWLKTI